MKNITLSANEHVIEHARAIARERHTTLNQMFRDWLVTFDSGSERVSNYREFMKDTVKQVSVGKKKISREEMNER